VVAREDRPVNEPQPAPLVEVREVTKRFDGVTAVDNVSLDIQRGELFAILGSSGCGKTTLLRMLAGFEHPSAGRILIDGADMTGVPPYERPVNLMFQSYALFPHMTVEQNVGYGLRKERLPKPQIRERVAEMLSLVKLGPLAGRKPDKLSGGEKQRVALARSLVKRPKLLLLDEPLAALDKKLREHTQFELANLQYQLGTTFVVVTHDQDEAMTLASRIAVMHEGRIAQVGTPGEVYEYPANRYVAGFVGNINLIDGRVTGAAGGRLTLRAEALDADLTVACDDTPGPDGGVCVAVRPEKITISREAPNGAERNVVRGIVRDLGYFGDQSLYRVRTRSGAILQVSAQNLRRSAKLTVEWDDEVYLSWEVGSTILLRS
jgi:putrescine transport system ATP-binding protein